MTLRDCVGGMFGTGFERFARAVKAHFQGGFPENQQTA